MNKETLRKLVMSGVIAAIGVILSYINIPVGIAKIFPGQHFINVVSAIILGPYYAVLTAFVISTIRIIIGAGTILAYPGSMIGAFLAGVLFLKFRKSIFAVIGEVIGTGIIASIASLPVAVFFMNKEVYFTMFFIPFLFSSVTGAIIGGVFVQLMGNSKNKLFSK